MAQFQFDTGSVEKRENNYELLPAGFYTAQVTDSSIAPLKSGNGEGLKLTFTVLSDNYRGRKVFANLNVRHSNPKAETIAQQLLRELCESIGLARLNDTVELHNKPVQIKVKVRKDETGNYSDQNEVAGFQPAAGGQALVAARPLAAPAAPAANAAAAPPWAKRAA